MTKLVPAVMALGLLAVRPELSGLPVVRNAAGGALGGSQVLIGTPNRGRARILGRSPRGTPRGGAAPPGPG